MGRGDDMEGTRVCGYVGIGGTRVYMRDTRVSGQERWGGIIEDKRASGYGRYELRRNRKYESIEIHIY